MFSPRRQTVPAEALEGESQGVKAVAEVLARNVEELARGVEVASIAGVQSQAVTLTAPLAGPLILAKATGAQALWMGRVREQAGESVMSAGVRWQPTRGGARIDEVGLPAGTYSVTFCWVSS